MMDFSSVMAELSALRQFAGAPKEFWPRFLAAGAVLTVADAAVLLFGSPGKEPHWTKIGEWNSGSGLSKARTQFTSHLEAIAERCLGGNFVEHADAAEGFFTIAVRMKLLNPADEVVLAAQLKDSTEAAARESLMRLNLIADVPVAFQQNLAAQKARSDVEKFAAVLDLNVPVNAESGD